MKKKEICNEYKRLKTTFAKKCSDLRADNDVEFKKENSIIYKTLTVKDLAEKFSEIIKSEYDPSRISRIEHASASMTILDLYLYHKHYNVSYNYLLGETINKTDEHYRTWEQYGLSDNTLKMLKTFVETSRKKEITMLNEIFASGFVQQFLNFLYDYVHNDFENRLPEEYKPTGAEAVEVEIKTKTDKLDLGTDIFTLDKLNVLNRQLLYDKIEEIKLSLNKQNKKYTSSKILKNLYNK